MRNRVLDAVFLAVDEVNRTLPPERRLSKDAETPLLGGEGVDSVTVVNLIVETELAVEQAFGMPVDLGQPATASAQSAPLATLGTFAAYVESLLAEARRA